MRACGIVCLLGLLLTTEAHSIQFQDVTDSSGISYTGRSWGSMWGDFDGDGAPDVWMVNHQNTPALYLNQGNGEFVDIYGSIVDPAYLVAYDKHGVGWVDYDNDGDQDIYQLADEGAGGPVPNWFFENDNGMLVEKAAPLGLDYIKGRGRMPLWMDFDRDGLVDVFHPVHQRGDGTDSSAAMFQQGPSGFTNVSTTVGLVPTPKSTNFALLGDMSGDGNLEFLVHLSRFPENVFDMSGLPFVDVRTSLGIPTICCVVDAVIADLDGDLDNDLYMVRGERTQDFALVDSTTLEVHLQGSSSLPPFGTETGISFQTTGDVTIDPYPFWTVNDIFIGSTGHQPQPASFPFTVSSADSSDWGIFPHTPGVDTGLYVGWDSVNQLWEIQRTDKVANLVITSTAPISNVLPLGWTTAELPRTDVLLENVGAGNWQNQTLSKGITVPSSGRNVVAGDLDNDMDLDLYIVASGQVLNQPNIIYENQGNGTFTLVPNAGGAAGDSLGRGDAVTTVDYDGDGFLDLLVTNGVSKAPFDDDGPTYLFRNQGNANHWLEIDLVGGPSSNRDGIGARVLATAGGVTQLREQNTGAHYRGQNHQRIHFGLGSNTQVDTLSVRWPNGLVRELYDVAADQIIQVTENMTGPAVTEAQVTADPASDQRPSWRPDGTQLAFDSDRSGNFDLWVVPSTGGAATQITTATVVDEHPDWSPDDSLLVYSSAVGSGNSNGELWLVPPTGGTPTLLHSNTATDDRLPVWSPDGTQIAFTKDSDIYVIPATGGTPTQLTTAPGLDVHPTWSPDGTEIAFVSDRTGNNDIWVIPAAGGAATQITSDPGTDSTPDWSPDGLRISFQSDRSGNDDIWVTSAHGGSPAQLTTAGQFDVQPDWSTAGDQIAFNRGGNIWTLTFPVSDIAVTKAVDNLTPAVGATLTYTITVANNGPEDAPGVAVTDLLPSGVTFQSATTSLGAYNSNTGVWTVGTVTVAASDTLTITATVDSTSGGLTVVNTASLSALSFDRADTVRTNNSASAAVTVQGVLALSSADNQTFVSGSGPTPISPITITDDASIPGMTAANDLRVRIPTGLDMTWDVSDLTATISGPAAAKVSSTVTYEDSSKTLVLDVTTDFAANDRITVSDLSFANFGALSPEDSLELEIGDDGMVSAEDDKTSRVVVPTAVVEPDRIPSLYALQTGYPNPFRTTTKIRFDIPARGPTSLAVYNVTGRRVSTLVDGVLEPGRHAARWDGRDSGGTRVATGVYFVWLHSGSFTATRKLVRLQ